MCVKLSKVKKSTHFHYFFFCWYKTLSFFFFVKFIYYLFLQSFWAVFTSLINFVNNSVFSAFISLFSCCKIFAVKEAKNYYFFFCLFIRLNSSYIIFFIFSYSLFIIYLINFYFSLSNYYYYYWRNQKFRFFSSSLWILQNKKK